MSQMIPLNQIENGDVFGMLIDDTSVFNLQILQAGLGLEERSVKAWCAKRGIRPVSHGRTWLFTGRTFRADLEAYQKKEIGDETGEGVCQKGGRKAVSATRLAGSRKRK